MVEFGIALICRPCEYLLRSGISIGGRSVISLQHAL
jgi:hypothetical protein